MSMPRWRPAYFMPARSPFRRSSSIWSAAASRFARWRLPMQADQIAKLAFAKQDGLLPAIVQHAQTGQVLMLGYMNRNALDKTLASGKVTFFSRSRQCLWTKGETSGHVLDLVRSEEHTSELQSLMRISYAVFCLKKKTQISTRNNNST